MNNNLLAPLTIIALLAMSASALADDKTSDKGPSVAPNDPYGKSPTRTERGTPLVGDFDEKGQIGKKGQSKPLPPKGSFGPAGGRVEKEANKQRMQQEREQSKRAWDARYGQEDPSKRQSQ